MNDYVVLLYEDGVLVLTALEYKTRSDILAVWDKAFNVKADTMLSAAFKAGEMNK